MLFHVPLARQTVEPLAAFEIAVLTFPLTATVVEQFGVGAPATPTTLLLVGGGGGGGAVVVLVLVVCVLVVCVAGLGVAVDVVLVDVAVVVSSTRMGSPPRRCRSGRTTQGSTH